MFVTPRQQALNTCTNKFITINGITKTQIEWAREIGITDVALMIRLKNKLSGDDLIAPPHQGRGKRDTDITINGITKSAAAWGRDVGVNESTFLWRIKKWGIGEHLLVGNKKAASLIRRNNEGYTPH
jgi:hypothetical protein